MSSSVNEEKTEGSFKSFKLYVAVRTGRAIKRIVGKNTALPIVAGRLKGKKWIVGGGITQVLGRWQEQYTDKFAESISPSSVVYDVGANAGWYTFWLPSWQVRGAKSSPLNHYHQSYAT